MEEPVTDHDDVDLASRGRSLVQATLGAATVFLLHLVVLGALLLFGWAGSAAGIDTVSTGAFALMTTALLLVGVTQVVYVAPVFAIALWFQQRAFAAGLGIGAGLTILLNGCAAGLLGGAVALCFGLVMNAM